MNSNLSAAKTETRKQEPECSLSDRIAAWILLAILAAGVAYMMAAAFR